MKTVIQKVKTASVTVDGQIVSSIGKGLVILAGIGRDDTIADVETMAKRVLKVKLWPDDDGRNWRRNVQDIEGEILCVSQFTLYASTKKHSPEFHKSAPTAVAKELYEKFLSAVQFKYKSDRVKDGVFQAMMDVALVNDGPITIQMDTRVEQSDADITDQASSI